MDWTQCYACEIRSLFEENQKLNVYIGETILACTNKILQKLVCAGVLTVFFGVFAGLLGCYLQCLFHCF